MDILKRKNLANTANVSTNLRSLLFIFHACICAGVCVGGVGVGVCGGSFQVNEM